MSRQQQVLSSVGTDSLADILDRVLDKGIVIAGDVKINLGDVELLTIRIRLLVCSVDKAQELGIDWWRGDSFYNGRMGAIREASPGLPAAADAPAAGPATHDGELEMLRCRIVALEGQARGATAEVVRR